jgi:hypothetical protein
MVCKLIKLDSYIGFIFFLLFVSMLYLTRAYGLVKLPLLFLCFLVSLFSLIKINNIKYDRYISYYVFSVMLGAVVWSLYGLFLGNSVVAIWNTIRLFVVYYIVYFVITLFLSKRIYYNDLELPICIALILISLTSFIAIYDINLFPESFSKSLELRVGIHEGYVQNASHHIGMLGFIFPYLFTLFVFKCQHRKWLVNLSCLLCLITILLSSRRAIYVVVLVMPFVITFLYFLINDNLKSKTTFRMFKVFCISLMFVMVFIYWFYISYPEAFFGFVERILSAVNQLDSTSNTSLRSLQADSLIKGLNESPLLGSGFGGVADFVRSSDGWVYELSYHVLLFNLGVIGFSFFVIITLGLFLRLIYVLRTYRSPNQFHCIALMSGVFGMYILSYSNPYISSSFDFIFINFVIPFALLKEVNFES